MKGITLISDIFLMVSLLGIAVIMSLFIWALITIFNVESKFVPGGMPTTRNVELKLLFKPANYESLMSVFLEYESQGIKMKKILNAVAIQGKTDIWLEGKTIDAKTVSETFLTPQINKDYILKIGDIIVAEHGSLSSLSGSLPLGIQKVSTFLFTLNGKEVFMQLFVVD